MSRKFYCSECGKELIITRMALPKKAIILDLVEPHECTESVDLENHFSGIDCPTYIPQVGKGSKTVQISNELDSLLSDRRSKEHVKDTSPTTLAPLNILDKISQQIKGE